MNHLIKLLNPNFIPHNVTSLSIGDRFNCISNFNSIIEPFSLPLSLTELNIGAHYQYRINENVLPLNLTSLYICNYHFPISFDSLNSLKFLIIRYYDIPIDKEIILPKNLTTLILPQSITAIDFLRLNQSIPKGYFINHINLKILRLDMKDFNIPLNTLPNSLTSLTLSSKINF